MVRRCRATSRPTRRTATKRPSAPLRYVRPRNANATAASPIAAASHRNHRARKFGVSVVCTASGTGAIVVFGATVGLLLAISEGDGPGADCAASRSVPPAATTMGMGAVRRVTYFLSWGSKYVKAIAGMVSAPARRGAMVWENTFSPAVGAAPDLKVDVTP